MEAAVLPSTVPIRWRAPFATGAAYQEERPAGETLLEIARSVPNLPDVFFRRGVICINGHEIEREAWHLVRPKPNTHEKPLAVTMHLAVQGGGGGNGGGSKQVIAIVAAIALTVATAGIGAGALGTLTGIAAIGPGTIGAAAAAAATGVTGRLAVFGTATRG